MIALNLIIVDRELQRLNAAQRVFGGDPNFDVVHGDIRALSGYDCLITPGNSFGIMDGGFDEVVREMFENIEPYIQQRILMESYGELNVGDAVLAGAKVGGPYLCYAPTMRVPMQITRTDNVYRAMRAALLQVLHHNDGIEISGDKPISTIATPLLGTGAGKLHPDTAAWQMWLAWDSIMKIRQPKTLAEADAIQAAIGLGLGGDPDNY